MKSQVQIISSSKRFPHNHNMRKAKKMRCLGNAQISLSTDTCSCAWLTLKVKQVVWPNPINVYQPYLSLIWDQGKCQNSNHNFWITDFKLTRRQREWWHEHKYLSFNFAEGDQNPFFLQWDGWWPKVCQWGFVKGLGKGSKVVGIRCHPLSRVHPHLPDCPIPS